MSSSKLDEIEPVSQTSQILSQWQHESKLAGKVQQIIANEEEINENSQREYASLNQTVLLSAQAEIFSTTTNNNDMDDEDDDDKLLKKLN